MPKVADNNTMLKALITLTLILAGGATNAQTAEEIEKEQREYGSSIKEQEVSQQVLETEAFKECKSSAEGIADVEAKNQNIRECFSNKLDETDDEAIKEISKNLDLAGYATEASKSASSVREYLKERLDEAIYGKKTDDITQRVKFVDHKTFYDLYQTQVSKNVLLEISNYCLENLRLKKGDEIVPFTLNCKIQEPGKFDECSAPFGGLTPEEENSDDPKATEEAIKRIRYQFWATKAAEVEYKAGDPENGAKAIEKIMKEELDKGANYLSKKYGVCLLSVSGMCKRYECKNTITDTENKDCKLMFGDAWAPAKPVEKDIALKEKDKEKDGRIACALYEKITEYRRNIKAVEESSKKFEEAGLDDSKGFDLGSAYTGVYQGGKGEGEKTFQELSSISSKEIINNDKIKEYQNADERGEELEKKCANEDPNNLSPECQGLLATTEDELKKVEVEYEASTALEIKKIKALKDNKEELTAYLKANGLEEYANDIDKLDEEKLAQMIADKYKARRLAVLQRLKDQFQEKAAPKVDGQKDRQQNTAQIQSAIKNSTEEIKESNERIGNILHYNNIITSFLTTITQGPDGEKIESKSFGGGLKVEREGFEQYAKDDEKAEAEKYFSNLDEGRGTASNEDSNSTGAITSTFIDNVLNGFENNGPSEAKEN